MQEYLNMTGCATVQTQISVSLRSIPLFDVTKKKHPRWSYPVQAQTQSFIYLELVLKTTQGKNFTSIFFVITRNISHQQPPIKQKYSKECDSSCSCLEVDLSWYLNDRLWRDLRLTVFLGQVLASIPAHEQGWESIVARDLVF